MLAGYNQVAEPERSALHQYGGYITTSLIQRSFNDRSVGFLVRIGLQVEQLGFQQDFFQERVNVHTCFG
jgi:hypothetical protein